MHAKEQYWTSKTRSYLGLCITYYSVVLLKVTDCIAVIRGELIRTVIGIDIGVFSMYEKYSL